MNWDAIAAIADVLAALGVIGSLIYLGRQVRGSLTQARQAAIQSLVNQMNTVWTGMAMNRDDADIWVRGSKGMSGLEDETDGVRFSALLLSIFRPYEELFYYRRDSVVDDWTWESIGSQCHALMGTPGFRDWWAKRGPWFSTAFQEHIEITLKSLPDYQRWSD